MTGRDEEVEQWSGGKVVERESDEVEEMNEQRIMEEWRQVSGGVRRW